MEEKSKPREGKPKDKGKENPRISLPTIETSQQVTREAKKTRSRPGAVLTQYICYKGEPRFLLPAAWNER
jgi:hypothetical protein